MPTDNSPSSLDPRRIYRTEETRNYLGVGNSTLWEMVRDGRLAKPLKLGPRLRGWLGQDILDRQEVLLAERNNSK